MSLTECAILNNICSLVHETPFLLKSHLSISYTYVYIIDQARGQDGWILAEFSFCVFMDRDEVEVHKNLPFMDIFMDKAHPEFS